MGVLAAIGEKCGRERPFPILTGVSAGAINASFLAGFRSGFLAGCQDLSRAWLNLSLGSVFDTRGSSLLGSAASWGWTLAAGGRLAPRLEGFFDTTPLHDYLSRKLDFSNIQANIDDGNLRAVALSATSYDTGHTTTFVQGPSDIAMWRRSNRHSLRTRITVDHVLASSALPLLFPAIEIGGRYFGDGSIRQNCPLAPAVHLGADRILAISVRHRGSRRQEMIEERTGRYPPPGQIFGMLLNAVFLDALEADAERLERVNRTLALLPRWRRHPEGLRPIRFLILRPSCDLGKLATNLEKDLPRSLRRLVRALGAQDSKTPDLLSYLLFEEHYVERLIELGYKDALAQWDRIGRFLEI